MDESAIYVEKQTQRFLEWRKKETEKEKWNENIDLVCYSLESFQKLVVEENNAFEEKWKRRILIEHTPRGNIIMYYDIFKHAFAYASDQNMPYNILNACAMKYVIMFRCMDFFVDSTILPDDIISPFSLLENEAESSKKKEAIQKKKELGISFKDAPFAKLKSYGNSSSSSSQKDKKTESDSKSKPISKAGDMIKYSNNFRNLGKFSNVSFLLKPKKTASNSNSIENNHTYLSSFDYLSYKKSLLEKNK
jgi:hypothetical protein